MVVPAQAPSSSNANYDERRKRCEVPVQNKVGDNLCTDCQKVCCVCVLYGTQSIVPFTFCDGWPLVSGGVGQEQGGTSRTDQVSPLKSNEQFLGIADLGITKEKNLS